MTNIERLRGFSAPGTTPGFAPIAAEPEPSFGAPSLSEDRSPGATRDGDGTEVDDARILDLVLEYWRRRRIEIKAEIEKDRLRSVYKAIRPVPPPEIRRDAIEQYAKLGPKFFCDGETEAKSHISRPGVDWLAANPRTRPVMVTWSDRRKSFEQAVDQDAESKVQAMLAIYNRWAAECLAVSDRLGSLAATRAYEIANDAAEEAAYNVCDERPLTFFGFAAVASIMVDRDWDPSCLVEDLASFAAHLRPDDIPIAAFEPLGFMAPVREVA